MAYIYTYAMYVHTYTTYVYTYMAYIYTYTTYVYTHTTYIYTYTTYVYTHTTYIYTYTTYVYTYTTYGYTYMAYIYIYATYVYTYTTYVYTYMAYIYIYATYVYTYTTYVYTYTIYMRKHSIRNIGFTPKVRGKEKGSQEGLGLRKQSQQERVREQTRLSKISSGKCLEISLPPWLSLLPPTFQQNYHQINTFNSMDRKKSDPRFPNETTVALESPGKAGAGKFLNSNTKPSPSQTGKQNAHSVCKPQQDILLTSEQN
ncbi:hypothetical protein PANDA_010153 [Ailuropoda melanoleuca]|uniref:Uncharacterized protein n=1 Tax=Ailuropoda melanoleuca TaxID=9646 RepID=D2HGJ6_AILME|nr:hypothetical protein PANDA_010153 [Ailuropoda melanoleuca]